MSQARGTHQFVFTLHLWPVHIQQIFHHQGLCISHLVQCIHSTTPTCSHTSFNTKGSVHAGSPSWGGDVAVYVFDINQPSLPIPLFCSCVYFCLHGPFNCISFHKFSRQLSAFSLCSSGLVSALLVLSTMYLMWKSPQPWCDPLRLTGLKAPTD